MGPTCAFRKSFDQRFAIGKHVYVCTPHEVLGMAGIIYVVDEPK